ncbi:MAG: hypothetical protein AAFQ43_15160, partial [Bacteroidota bacterium]
MYCERARPLLFAGPLAPEAQGWGSPDPTRYAPLAVGDAWHYQDCDVGCAQRIELQAVLREETISD